MNLDGLPRRAERLAGQHYGPNQCTLVVLPMRPDFRVGQPVAPDDPTFLVCAELRSE